MKVQLKALALADAATIRDNLLHVLGAGLSRLSAESYPTPFDVDLALILQIQEAYESVDLEVRVECRPFNEAGSPVIFEAGAVVPTPTRDPEDGVFVNFPLVVPLRGTGIPIPGAYELHVVLDGEVAGSVGFQALLIDEQPSLIDEPAPTI